MGKFLDWILENQLWLYVIIIAVMLFCVRGCNMAWNHGTEARPGYQTVSYATGFDRTC